MSTDAKKKRGISRKWEMLAYGAVIVGAVFQAGLGGRVTESGEQVGLSLPVGTIVLFVSVVLILLRQVRPPPLPVPTWPHVVSFSLLLLGVLGMSTPDLTHAIKEFVQAGEIFVVAWYLFWVADNDMRGRMANVLAWAGIALATLGLGQAYALPPLGLSTTKYGALLCMATPFVLLRATRLPGIPRALIPGLLCLSAGLHISSGGLLLVFMATLGVALWRWEPGRRWLIAPMVATVLAASLLPLPGQRTGWDSLVPAYADGHNKRVFIEARASFLAPSHYPFGSGLGHYKRSINVLRQYLPLEPHPQENKIPRDSNNQYLLLLVEAGFGASLALIILLLTTARSAWKRLGEGQGAAREVDAAAVFALLAGTSAGLFCTILTRGTGVWIGSLLGWVMGGIVPSAKRPSWLRYAIPAAAAVLGLTCMLVINRDVDPVDHRSVMNRRVAGLFQPTRRSTAVAAPVAERAATLLPAQTMRIEGEDYVSATGPFVRIHANDTSGNQVLEIPDASGKAVGEARYVIQDAGAGAYELFARVYWKDGCGNSLGFSLGGGRGVVSSELFGEWHELRCKQAFVLPAGTSTLLVHNVEDGVRLDYIELRPVGNAGR